MRTSKLAILGLWIFLCHQRVNFGDKDAKQILKDTIINRVDPDPYDENNFQYFMENRSQNHH